MIAPGGYRESTKTTVLQNWLLATGMTGVTVLCARISVPIPFTPVPITMQPFAVMLAGLLLGRAWGMVALAQYLLLGAVGAHVFSGGGFGSAALLGVTGGYLIAYPIAAYLIGWISGGGKATGNGGFTVGRDLIACLAGIAVIYTLGTVWLGLATHQKSALLVLQGAAIFLPWDIVKAFAAVAVAKGLGSFRHGQIG